MGPQPLLNSSPYSTSRNKLSIPVSITCESRQVCFSPGSLTKRRSNMLEDSLFESQGRGKTRKPFTMAIAVVAHAVTITGLVLIPLLQTQAITLPPINLPLLLPRTNVPESAVPLVPAQPPIQQYAQPAADAFIAPTTIPHDIV